VKALTVDLTFDTSPSNQMLGTNLILKQCRAYSIDTNAFLRTFISTFSSRTLPKTQYTSSFSRSSGPGGQSVNKTSSKATVFFKIMGFPTIVQDRIRSSFANRLNASNELVINCDMHRGQSQNYEQCFDKMDEIVKTACAVDNDTSPETKAKVRAHAKRFDTKRLQMKTFAAGKKQNRKGGSDR
jgi:peptidyl-tRNA hydrolase ICT1